MPAWIGLLVLYLCVPLRASDLPPAFVLNFPISADLTTPSWLGAPEIPSTQFATLNLPILTPETAASLLVTVYFHEKEGGFMRIVWNGTQGAQTLSDNFYDNIGMANQRSLLIPPSTLVGDGTLTFQCGDSTLGIDRIKFEWLENRNGLVSPAVTDLLVTPAAAPTQGAETLNGQPNPAGPGSWQAQLVTVPITDGALRVEEGVVFSVQLDQVPTVARLALKEAGLAFGRRIVVWVNEQRAGTITPTVPDLLDSGFMAAPDTTTTAISYTGWRDGSFYVPVALLKTGVNTLQFSDEDDGGAASTTSSSTADTPALALKSVVLQLDYSSLQAPTTPVASPTTPAVQPTQTSSQTPGPIPPSSADQADWTSPGSISAQAASTSTPASP